MAQHTEHALVGLTVSLQFYRVCSMPHSIALGTNCCNGHFGGRSANLRFENDLLPHTALSREQLLFNGTLRDSAGTRCYIGMLATNMVGRRVYVCVGNSAS